MKVTADILACANQVPPLPGTVVRLVSVLNDPHSTVDQIVQVIKYDPALTSRMLQICNSAYAGLSRQVHSLDEAMRYLGTVRVLQLALAIHTDNLMNKGQQGYRLAPGVLWKHSVAVALAATFLSRRIGVENANLAFTAGLLHDIGKIVLSVYVSQQFDEISRIVTDEHVSFRDAEQRVLGVSHEEVGAELAQKWQLPEKMIRCIRHHHCPGDLTPHDDLVDVVYLADCVCLLLGVGIGADELHYRADAEVMHRHGLSEADLELTGIHMLTEFRRIEQLFGDTPDACGCGRNT